MTQSGTKGGIPTGIPSGFTSGTPSRTTNGTTTVPTLPGPHRNYLSKYIDIFLSYFDLLTHLHALDVGSLFTSPCHCPSKRGCLNLSVLTEYSAISSTSPVY